MRLNIVGETGPHSGRSLTYREIAESSWTLKGPDSTPAFAFSPKVKREPVETAVSTPRPPRPEGPIKPAGLKGENPVIRTPEGAGKADPVWGTAFTTKFSKKPKAETAELRTPKGALKVIAEFESRVAELDYLMRTQHQDLPSTQRMLRANGIGGFSITSAEAVEDVPTPDELEDAADAAEAHLGMTPYAVRLADGTYGDLVYIRTMSDRIEWEKFRTSCSKLTRARFMKMRDGTLGIDAAGERLDPETELALRKKVKAAWLAEHDALPTPQDIADAVIRIKGTKVQHRMTDAEFALHERSTLFGGDEDLDPIRVSFHADNDPEPRRTEFAEGECVLCDIAKDDHYDCDEVGKADFTEAHDAWVERELVKGRVGYGGPSGWLGTDVDDVVVPSDEE